jgi:hypothetical protein
MNKDFKQWLEQQEYTLTIIRKLKSGIPYMWDELMYHTDQNNRREVICRREYTWGLWRTIDEQ